MPNSGRDTITVLGAGVLGGQIAWHSAFRGKTAAVYDPFADALERAQAAHRNYADSYRDSLGADEAAIEATRSRLSYHSDLAAAVGDVDLVVEAVPDVPDVGAVPQIVNAALLS